MPKFFNIGTMRVLVIGGGGREHALCRGISRSSGLDELFIIPGNAGTDMLGTNINIKATDFQQIKGFCISSSIDMVIVGPEDPLVEGIVDYLLADSTCSKVMIIGPTQKGAQIEGSKDFAKEFMHRYNIPTARYLTITPDNKEEGITFLESLNPPYVLKADGLAGGKGVIIHNDITKAKEELIAMLDGKFGEASQRVVIEEYLDGIEVSAFVLTDGVNYKILPEAKDYKRAGENDTGSNTGGMGSVSPVPFYDNSFKNKVEEKVIRPTIEGLREEGIQYNGFIFFGLMNVKGEPYMVEYNARMGDPEAEVVLPRIQTDLLQLFEGVSRQNLNKHEIEYDSRTAASVMAVSGGYPGKYEKSKVISGLEYIKDSIVFHAGTKIDEEKIKTAGGRVLAITGMGRNLDSALKTAYDDIAKIDFEYMYYRSDIGFDL